MMTCKFCNSGFESRSGNCFCTAKGPLDPAIHPAAAHSGYCRFACVSAEETAIKRRRDRRAECKRLKAECAKYVAGVTVNSETFLRLFLLLHGIKPADLGRQYTHLERERATLFALSGSIKSVAINQGVSTHAIETSLKNVAHKLRQFKGSAWCEARLK